MAETHSFTRAAERSRVSQPTLTGAIKKLENELGGPLLLRARGGSKLTPLGRMILPRLQRIEDESRCVSLAAENHRRLKQVPLRVGVLNTIGPARLSGHLAAFRAVAPGVEVEFHAGSQDTVLQLGEPPIDDLGAATALASGIVPRTAFSYPLGIIPRYEPAGAPPPCLDASRSDSASEVCLESGRFRSPEVHYGHVSVSAASRGGRLTCRGRGGKYADISLLAVGRTDSGEEG